MSKQFRPRSAAALRRSIIRRYWLLTAFAAGALLMQGCASIPPQPFDGAKASDPNVRVPPPAYRSVLGSYSSQRPVEPSPWIERNQQVAPAPKKDGQ